MRTTFEVLLSSGETILTDGAMGTMLFSLGLGQGEPPERWNLEQPEKVEWVHRQYVESGAQIILTNTFGANRIRLGFHGLESAVGEYNQHAAHLARGVADAAEGPVLVVGSIGPTGSFFEPLGELRYQDAVEIFREQSTSLYEGGVDAFWIETMYSLEEIQAAVDGCRSASPDLPVITTMTFDMGGKTLMGTSPEEAAERLRMLDVRSLGGNCGNGPEEVEQAIDAMHKLDPSLVTVAKANAGIPHIEAGQPVYDASPQDMARYAVRARMVGARIIGACCGSTPEHIRAMAAALENGRGPA